MSVNHLPVPCKLGPHLGLSGAPECERAAQLVVLWRYAPYTLPGCRACAALFVLHHRCMAVYTVPWATPGKETPKLLLNGKRRSVYLHVLYGIQSGRWTPGALMPTTAELADTCRCARSTADSGLRAAASDGWLLPGPGSTYMVAPAAQWPQPAPPETVQNRTIGGGR